MTYLVFDGKYKKLSFSLEEIAFNRAKYYAEELGIDVHTLWHTYNEEELIDWFLNNMDSNDVEDKKCVYKEKNYDLEDYYRVTIE